jgi:hypothetical protein
MTVHVERRVLVVTLACLLAQPATAQVRSPTPASDRGPNRYDDTFRKYSKRYFGPGYDWRAFKAQGMTESNLH